METDDKFIEGKLYRVLYAKNNLMFCKYNSNEVLSCKENAFIFLEKNKLKNHGYLFYAVSECAIVDIDGRWAITRLKEVE